MERVGLARPGVCWPTAPGSVAAMMVAVRDNDVFEHPAGRSSLDMLRDSTRHDEPKLNTEHEDDAQVKTIKRRPSSR